METKIRAIQVGTTNEIDLKATRDGELRVTQYLPAYANLVAAGKVFGFESSAGTAKGPVTAVPTTTATWSLYNASTTAHIVILRVAFAAVSGTMGLGAAIVGTVAIGNQTAEVAKYTSSVVGCLDGTAKTPDAFFANATTLVGTQSPWIFLAARDMLAVVAVGAGLVADVDGLMVVPPKGCAGFDILAPAGTSALFDCSIIAAQLVLDTA
uniref:Uncharacterized protein n=1 Tax=viral metagenome TaxID=1070528 RepID=A0A6M3J2G5_9ZZZZ